MTQDDSSATDGLEMQDCIHPHLKLEHVSPEDHGSFYKCDVCKRNFSTDLKPFAIHIVTVTS